MIVRSTLATGVLMVGLAFVPLGCEDWNRPMLTPVHRLREAPDLRRIPESVLQGIEDCARSLPAPLPGEESLGDLVGFGAQVDEGGQVHAVRLGRSTLGDQGVEACMAGAVHGMTLPLYQLGTLIGEGGGKLPVSPEVAGLLADDAQESMQMIPVALSVAGRVILVVVVIWAVYEVVKAVVAPAKATSAAPPRAAAPPKARKYPNQTCEDEELAKLEAEKVKLCDEGYTVNCKGDWEHPDDRKRLESVPCSQAMKSLQERLACLHHRNLIEDLCFGGVPDAGHAQQIANVKLGIGHCKKMTENNCAEGHPMAGL